MTIMAAGSLSAVLCAMVALGYRCVSDLLPGEGDGSEVGQFQKEVEALPPELRRYIQEDNWRLEQEAEEWEEEQSCKIPSTASESQELSPESGLGDATSDFASCVEMNGQKGRCCGALFDFWVSKGLLK